MADDDDFFDEISFTERWILGIIIAAFLVVLLIIWWSPDPSEWDLSFGTDEWGIEEWGTILLGVLFVGIIGISFFLYTEDSTPEDAFISSRGFLYTIGAISVAVLLLNSGIIGIFDSDESDLYVTNAQGQTVVVPEGYVDYGSPQNYGYGSYGPQDEGILTDTQGGVAGCVAGAATLTVLGQVPPFTLLPEEIITVPIGCLAGGAFGYSFSASDLDGDPTTGW